MKGEYELLEVTLCLKNIFSSLKNEGWEIYP